ncbi:MAG: hypothetical protein ABSF68_10220 [Candidatus Acidiferrales bacterium]
MNPAPTDPERHDLTHLAFRLQELNNTATQVLLFLSFAIVAGVTYLASSLDAPRKLALQSSLRWWVFAIFPTVAVILPLKEISDDSIRWFRFLLWVRFFLLWAAIVCIFVGAIQFFRSI